MVTKKIRGFLFIFLIIILSSLTLSAPPVTTVQQFPEGYYISEQQYHEFKLGEPLRYGFLLENASNGVVINDSVINYCRLVISNSQGFNTQSINLSYNDTYRLWGIELNETQVNEIFPEVGFYNYAVSCQDDLGAVISGIFEVSLTGIDSDEYNIWAHLGLFLFFIGLVLAFYYINTNINYERWYRSIINRYEHRNTIKVIISSIGYNLMKNAFIWYYLLGLPMLLIITDIALVFGVTSMIELMKVILGIYYFGFILVGLFFFGYLQEWIMKIINDIKNLDFGVDND